MKFSDLKCECGYAGPMWHFDASILKEREFEGMYFEVRDVDNYIVVTGRAEDADYLEDFNMEKLGREAAEIVVEELDDDEPCCVSCPSCEELLA